MIRLDRRSAISLGVAAGAGLLWPGTPLAQSLPDSEPELVAFLLAGELLSVATVQRVLAVPHLGRRARRLATRILLAERAHVTALARAGRPLRARVPPLPLGSADAIDRALATRHVNRSVQDLHTEHNCLDLLLDLESMAEGLLYAAMPKLEAPVLRRLAAGLLAAEAEHEALLGLLRGPKNFDRATPYAFVEGRRP